jgi:hypothetical protein
MTQMPEMLMVADRGEVIATVRDSRDMVEAFRKAKDMLRLTNAHCDELAAMVEGHTDKVLGPSAQKEIGPLTFSKLCWLFAVKFEMVIDLEQMKVMAEHWEDRQRKRPLFPDGKVARISKKILEQAKPLVYRDCGAAGGRVRAALLTPKQRTKIARNAARKSGRLKGLSPERRVEIARAAGLASAAKRRAAAISATAVDCIGCKSDSMPEAV